MQKSKDSLKTCSESVNIYDFTCNLQTVKVWNRALTNDEINRSMYNIGTSNSTVCILASITEKDIFRENSIVTLKITLNSSCYVLELTFHDNFLQLLF